MEIMTSFGFRKFVGFKRKYEKCVKIELANGEKVEGSVDHRIKCFVDGNSGNGGKEWVRLDRIRRGDVVCCDGEAIDVVDVVDDGSDMVFSPVGVDGREYVSGGVDHHNCSFLGSSSTLISGECLDKLVQSEPVEYKYGYDMNVYEEPVDGGVYVMGVDTAMGNAGDYSVVQVIKIEGEGKYRQVAVYRRNTIQAEDFAEVVNGICEWYNNALYVVENNDLGRIVANKLYYDIGNGYIVSTDKSGALGTRADRNTKLDACRILKKMVEGEELKIVDSETITELSRFEEVSPNVYRAAAGKHDDLVSALYWACYCIMQPEVDVSGVRREVKTVDYDALPPPIYTDVGQGYGGNVFGAGMDANSFWAGLN